MLNELYWMNVIIYLGVGIVFPNIHLGICICIYQRSCHIQVCWCTNMDQNAHKIHHKILVCICIFRRRWFHTIHPLYIYLDCVNSMNKNFFNYPKLARIRNETIRTRRYQNENFFKCTKLNISTIWTLFFKKKSLFSHIRRVL